MDSVKLVKNETDNSYLPDLKENAYYPSVSIVTPTCNRHHIFDIAIYNWSNFIYPGEIEWIILDDSPKDSIKELKKKLPKQDKRIKYYTCKKIDKIGKKRNKINELTSNEIIIHMDDDDYYPPDSIINRVNSLTTYNKKCVGSCSVNCINLLDNTCFKTGGGLFENSVCTAEASLAYYKSFWEEQKYGDNVRNEECLELLYNRSKDYIDLNSAFNMIAITHSKNMSSRAILNTINRFNFFNELPVDVVNLLESIQLKIHNNLPGVAEAKDFIRSNQNKSYDTVISKIEKLPEEVKSTSIMSCFIENIHPRETIREKTIGVLYYPGRFYRNISQVNEKLNYKVIQIINFIKDNYNEYDITLYLWTLKSFTVDNIKIVPWYLFNNKKAFEKVVVVDEFSHVSTIVSYTQLEYLNLSNEDSIYPKELTDKVDKYYTYDNLNYILQNNNFKKAVYFKTFKYYYMGDTEELKNNKLFTEDYIPDDLTVYSSVHAYSYKIYKNDRIVHDNNYECEYVILNTVNIPFMCYIISVGAKYFIDKETEDSKKFNIIKITDNIPSNYYSILKDTLQKYTNLKIYNNK